MGRGSDKTNGYMCFPQPLRGGCKVELGSTLSNNEGRCDGPAPEQKRLLVLRG